MDTFLTTGGLLALGHKLIILVAENIRNISGLGLLGKENCLICHVMREYMICNLLAYYWKRKQMVKHPGLLVTIAMLVSDSSPIMLCYC